MSGGSLIPWDSTLYLPAPRACTSTMAASTVSDAGAIRNAHLITARVGSDLKKTAGIQRRMQSMTNAFRSLHLMNK